MKDSIMLLGTGSGFSTLALSINSIIEKTTPVIVYIGLIVGTITSILVCIYWFKKLFKKEKNEKKRRH